MRDKEFDRFDVGAAARLVGQVQAMTGNRAEAQDRVQEAFVRASAGRAAGRPAAPGGRLMTTRRTALAALLVGATVATTTTPAHAYPPVRRVLALGNSTTYNGIGDGTDWPTLCTELAAGRYRVTNAGRSRDTLAMMGARLHTQNLLAGHDTVVINGGTVEAQMCGVHGLTPVMTDLERIVAYCQARRVRVVVGSVVPLGRIRKADGGLTRSLHAVAAALYTRQGDLARRRGLPFVDNFRPLSDAYGELVPSCFDHAPGDAIHPGPTSGRLRMAAAAHAVLRSLT